ncbi:MAG TPA: YoaK family protein [bacterium]|nr:YoaK family protein [bacterium]
MATPAAPRKRLVLLLAGAAGCLDAVGYLMLGLFTANMTGNTILLGLSVGREAWADAVHNVVAIAAFVCGAGAGTAATRGAARIARGLGLEAAVLAAAVGVWAFFGAPRGRIAEPAAYWLIALLSAAMGMQSATVRRVGEHRVATTYVTGTLTTLATDTASDLLDRWMTRGAARDRQTAAAPPAGSAASPLLEGAKGLEVPRKTGAERGTALMTGLWAVYLFGALVGGFAEQRWAMLAVVAPVVVLVAVTASDLAAGRPWACGASQDCAGNHEIETGPKKGAAR